MSPQPCSCVQGNSLLRFAPVARVRQKRQEGMTLVITLVMLLIVGVVALSSLGGSERNLQIAGNMQQRQEALAASQAALEQTLSSSAFVRDPLAAAASPVPVDLDGDGTADREVRLDPAPACLRVRPIKMAELDPAATGDLACLGSSSQVSGRDFSSTATGDSLCGESLWNVSASVSDATTGAQVRIHQGVAIRIATTDAQNACP
ncbi:MAG: PilX N-terminal domain-containing pilus assembly protein [Burkholderiales bacterium]|jgi:type II secretory pathway pseudopilin PulG